MKKLLFLCLSCALCGATNAQQRAEYDRAATILMHEPGSELFLGVVHPAAALFETYFDVDAAAAEHRGYREALKKEGIKVLTVRDLLLAAPIEQLRELAGKYLVYDTSALTPESAATQENYRQQTLREASAEDLVRIVLHQPTIHLTHTGTNTDYAATYSERPVMNLYFMRDPMITTARGIVIGRLNSPQRELENDLAAFCVDQMGITPVGRIAHTEGAYLEGGDFIPCGNRAFIGCGMRTTQPAIDQLMQEDLLGCDSLIVVHDHWREQAQMHLDTYFNVVDRNLVTMMEHRLVARKDSPERPTCDLWVRPAEGEAYQKVQENSDFATFLKKDLGMKMISIPTADGLTYANNFLTIGPRRIMAVAGQSRTFERALDRQKVHVTWVPLTNLTRGYGAAHCMTQVIERY